MSKSTMPFSFCDVFIELRTRIFEDSLKKTPRRQSGEENHRRYSIDVVIFFRGRPLAANDSVCHPTGSDTNSFIALISK